jgi:hypothetical protein
MQRLPKSFSMTDRGSQSQIFWGGGNHARCIYEFKKKSNVTLA